MDLTAKVRSVFHACLLNKYSSQTSISLLIGCHSIVMLEHSSSDASMNCVVFTLFFHDALKLLLYFILILAWQNFR